MTRRGGRRLHAGSKCNGVAPFCAVLLLVGLAGSDVLAKPKEPKPPAAAEYIGHLVSVGHAYFLVHIDAFTSDDAAAAVALAGRDGNANSIRAALGRLDAGFIKLADNGCRIAFARRHVEDGGVRIILILRNALEDTSTIKELVIPPLAAVDVWLPNAGAGEATIASAATVVFRSSDDVEITDWGGEAHALDVRERKH